MSYRALYVQPPKGAIDVNDEALAQTACRAGVERLNMSLSCRTNVAPYIDNPSGPCVGAGTRIQRESFLCWATTGHAVSIRLTGG
jgi:hypothetical protein